MSGAETTFFHAHPQTHARARTPTHAPTHTLVPPTVPYHAERDKIDEAHASGEKHKAEEFDPEDARDAEDTFKNMAEKGVDWFHFEAWSVPFYEQKKKRFESD